MGEINSTLFFIAAVAAVAWGFFWAWFLDNTDWGRWAAIKRTWLTVAIGTGVDCAIFFVAIPWQYAAVASAIVLLSGIGIVRRSLEMERREDN